MPPRCARSYKMMGQDYAYGRQILWALCESGNTRAAGVAVDVVFQRIARVYIRIAPTMLSPSLISSVLPYPTNLSERCLVTILNLFLIRLLGNSTVSASEPAFLLLGKFDLSPCLAAVSGVVCPKNTGF